MEKLIFTTLATPGKLELDVLMLAESIRRFGGDLADSPIWVLTPTTQPLSTQAQEKLQKLKSEIIAFEVDSDILKFPFATKVIGAAFAEEHAHTQTERLTFMDGDTLMLQEPAEFLIPVNKILGYRPVHHKLIGSTWDEGIDLFWQLIYEICDVSGENIFPMRTHAGEKIRPYFNAGMFVTRPEKGLLTQWRDMFLKWYRKTQLEEYYEKNRLYAIFIHQAIFSGVLLHNLSVDEFIEFNPRINYPLHLHSDIPVNQRPKTINELITVRHEDILIHQTGNNSP